MSNVVNTGTVEFYRGRQNHSGSVAVPICGVPAELATKDSFTQRKRSFGSHRTARAGHRRVGGRNQHHLPARPRATFDQFAFGRPDRGISCFPGHRRFGQEPWFEVLYCDGVVICDHPTDPNTRSVSVLAGRLLMQSGSLTPRPQVSLRWRVSARATTTSHLPLRACKFSGAAAAVPSIRQVIGGAGGDRGRGDTPVDTEGAGSSWRGFGWPASHERGVPVPEGVPVDADGRRCGRQFPRPHHRDRHSFWQPQPAVSNRKPARRVLQRWQGSLARLEFRPSTALYLERMVQGGSIIAKQLLLGHLGALPQPRRPSACFGEHLRQPYERRIGAAELMVDSFVPQESATVPLRFERRHRVRTRSQAVGVTHDVVHATNYTTQPIATRWLSPIGQQRRLPPAATLWQKQTAAISVARCKLNVHSDFTRHIRVGTQSELSP